MPATSLVLVGGRETATHFRRVGIEAPRVLSRTARFYASKLKFAIQARSPVETGEYRDAWQVTQVGLNSFAITNDKPQMNRLEYGFDGTDSLGRVYHQPPQPHIRPAAYAIEKEFFAASVTAIDEVTR